MEQTIEDIKLELKKQIIQELNLQEISVEDIKDDAPLFVEGLGLDSIDALELVVIMEKYYGVKIPNEIVGREALQSINSMAEYIVKERAKRLTT
jgi:acyl carrier protein